MATIREALEKRKLCGEETGIQANYDTISSVALLLYDKDDESLVRNVCENMHLSVRRGDNCYTHNKRFAWVVRSSPNLSSIQRTCGRIRHNLKYNSENSPIITLLDSTNIEDHVFTQITQNINEPDYVVPVSDEERKSILPAMLEDVLRYATRNYLTEKDMCEWASQRLKLGQDECFWFKPNDEDNYQPIILKNEGDFNVYFCGNSEVFKLEECQGNFMGPMQRP